MEKIRFCYCFQRDSLYYKGLFCICMRHRTLDDIVIIAPKLPIATPRLQDCSKTPISTPRLQAVNNFAHYLLLPSNSIVHYITSSSNERNWSVFKIFVLYERNFKNRDFRFPFLYKKAYDSVYSFCCNPCIILDFYLKESYIISNVLRKIRHPNFWSYIL